MVWGDQKVIVNFCSAMEGQLMRQNWSALSMKLGACSKFLANPRSSLT
jgi:hypothetical protein